MKITQKELKRMLRRTPAKGWCQDRMPQFSLQNYSGLSFRGRNVSYIYFIGSDLSGTDFSKTTMDGTEFAYCNLQNASFQNAKGVNPMFNDANLEGACFAGAELRKGIFTGCNLRGADFTGANVYLCDFTGADLKGTNFTGAKFYKQACPETGAFVGWENALGISEDDDEITVLVKLFIPENARRCSGASHLCRASEAVVLEIEKLNGMPLESQTAFSRYDKNFVYRVGETVCTDEFEPNRWARISGGIHFFMEKDRARNQVFYDDTDF